MVEQKETAVIDKTDDMSAPAKVEAELLEKNIENVAISVEQPPTTEIQQLEDPLKNMEKESVESIKDNDDMNSNDTTQLDHMAADKPEVQEESAPEVQRESTHSEQVNLEKMDSEIEDVQVVNPDIINNDENEEKTTDEPKQLDIIIDTEPQESEVLPQFSDDEINVDNVSSSESDSSSDSDSDTDSSSDSDAEEEEEDEEEEHVKRKGAYDIDDEDDEGDAISGPIISKNETLNEKAPTLPEDYKIDENTPIELVGEIIGLVDNNVIIKANLSGEFRVLKENSVFCFKDRSVIGPLFETFGRVQQPVYSVKFNSSEEFEKFKDKKGEQVYYVVLDSQFLYTDAIKHIKGTDASNCHDEELPEEEQEYSDDEKESAAKSGKKKKNKNKNKNNEDQEHRAKRSSNFDENQSKRFQPYGYALPQLPPQQTPQQPPQQSPIQAAPSIPQTTLVPFRVQPSFPLPTPSSAYQAPQQQQWQQPLAQNSPYGIPFSQVQQFANQNQHQVYGQMQQNQFQYPQQGYPQQYPNIPNAQMGWNQPQNIQQQPPLQQGQPALQEQLKQLQQLIMNQLQQNGSGANFNNQTPQ